MERFWDKVDMGKDCWEWRAMVDMLGYGRFMFDGRKALAHRVAYELSVGTIPDGFDVHHTCGNRVCVNPAHLEALSRRDHRKRGGGPPFKSHCKHGHPLEDPNLYYAPQGQRYCKECRRATWRRQAQRRAAQHHRGEQVK